MKKRNSSRIGNYYKLRAKKFLEDRGYQVGTLENYRRIFTKGRVIMIKQDQFASDLLAVNKDDIIFVQVKFNRKVATMNVSTAIKEFKKFQFPKWSKQWVMVWQYRKREPEIIEVDKVDTK